MQRLTSCFTNCSWELYGVVDEDHFPSSGSRYDINITTGTFGMCLSYKHLCYTYMLMIHQQVDQHTPQIICASLQFKSVLCLDDLN